MAERVFPSNSNVDMGSKISFSGIDWSTVEENMKQQRNAGSQSEEIKKLLAGLTEEHSGETKEAMEDSETTEASGEVETTEASEEAEAITAEAETSSSYKGASSEKMRKIAFTHPSQISAEAIEKAEAAGDTELVKTILAARKANRQRIAAVIDSNLKKQAAAAKNTKRETTAQSAQNDVSPEAVKKMFGDNIPAELQSYTNETTLSFTEPTKFSRAQREAFTKVAVSLGMPKEYVAAMCEPVLSPEVQKLNQEIDEVYTSNISEVAKTAAVKTMIKEAKLSQESKEEFIRYWNDILGYQDKDFWKDVAADYEDGKKVN